jgi:hypothetical protein
MGTTQILDRKVIYVYATQDLMALHCVLTTDPYGQEIWQLVGITPWAEIMPHAITNCYAAQGISCIDRHGESVDLLREIKLWRAAAANGHLLNGKTIDANMLFTKALTHQSMPLRLANQYIEIAKQAQVTFSISDRDIDDNKVINFDLGDKNSIDFLSLCASQAQSHLEQTIGFMHKPVNQLQTLSTQQAVFAAIDFNMDALLSNCTHFGDAHVAKAFARAPSIPTVAVFTSNWRNPQSQQIEILEKVYVRFDEMQGQIISTSNRMEDLIIAAIAASERINPGSAESAVNCFQPHFHEAKLLDAALHVNLSFANDRVPVPMLGESESNTLKVINALYEGNENVLFARVQSGFSKTDDDGKPIKVFETLLQWNQMRTTGAIYCFHEGHEHPLGDNEQELIQSALMPFGYRMDEVGLDILDGVGVSVVEIATGEHLTDFSNQIILRLAEQYSINEGVTT